MKMVTADSPERTIENSTKQVKGYSNESSEVSGTTTIPLDFDFGRGHHAKSHRAPARDPQSSTRKRRRSPNISQSLMSKRIRETSPAPTDWQKVRIKVEKTSDTELSPKTTTRIKKKSVKSSSDTGESSTTSSSSDADREKRRKRRRHKNRKQTRRSRKRKLSKSCKANSESSNSSTSTSSSEDSSSEETSNKRKRKKNSKRKHKAKRSKNRKKRSRKRSAETKSCASSTEENITKLRKGKDEGSNIQEIDAVALPEEETKIHEISLAKVKVERRREPVKSIEPIESIDKVAESSAPDLPESSQLVQNNRDNLPESWDTDMSIGAEKISGHAGSAENTASVSQLVDKNEKSSPTMAKSVEGIEDKVERSSRLSPGSEKTTKKRRDRDRSSSSSTSSSSSGSASSSTSDTSTSSSSSGSRKSSRKSKRREKWSTTEFDTLNVLSLTQLEKVARKRDLTNDWEVDSMEETHECTIVPSIREKFSKSSKTKKIPKEVRYDRTTDTYIAVEAEESRAARKSHARLCAMRIWEEEEEEGEREQLLLSKDRQKREISMKVKGWESEEETSAKATLGSPVKDCPVEIGKDLLDIEPKSAQDDQPDEKIRVEIENSKISRKSRWDISVQTPDETIVPVLWEKQAENDGNWRRILEKVEEPLSSPTTSTLILKKSFDGTSAAREKDAALYSPSSPGLSVKSEDNTNSSSSSEKSKEKIDESPEIRKIDSPVEFLPLEKSPESVAKIVDEEETAKTLGTWTTIVPGNENQQDDDNSHTDDTTAMREHRMDIFAEFSGDKSNREKAIEERNDAIVMESSKKLTEVPAVVVATTAAAARSTSSSSSETSERESDVKEIPSESKLSIIKLIPKQLLIRKPTDEAKSKSIVARVSTGLRILQHKIVNELEKNERKGQDDSRSTTPPLLPAQIAKLVPEIQELRKRSLTPPRTNSRLAKEETEYFAVEPKRSVDRERELRSPYVDQRKQVSGRKEKDKWKPIGGSNDRASHSNYRGASYGGPKDAKDRKRVEERDSRGFKNFGGADSRRRLSPPSSRGARRSGSPMGAWNRDPSCSRTRSRTRSRSWSRSRSRSPRRRNEGWERSKRGTRFSVDRRDKFSTSPSRHAAGGSGKGRQYH